MSVCKSDIILFIIFVDPCTQRSVSRVARYRAFSFCMGRFSMGHGRLADGLLVLNEKARYSDTAHRGGHNNTNLSSCDDSETYTHEKV